MTPRATRSFRLGPALGALLLSAAAGCSADPLPGFANPPPVDAGDPDAADDDGGAEPEAD